MCAHLAAEAADPEYGTTATRVAPNRSLRSGQRSCGSPSRRPRRDEAEPHRRPHPTRSPRASHAAARHVPPFANAAVETGSEHMQLGLAHRPLQPEQQTVVEQRRMIDAVGIPDQRVGKAGKIDEAMPVGVLLRASRDSASTPTSCLSTPAQKPSPQPAGLRNFTSAHLNMPGQSGLCGLGCLEWP